MPKKRKTPRRTLSPRCVVRGCKQIARIDTYCRSHAQREADRLFSLWIRQRDGKCKAWNVSPGCNGALQCAHVFSRRYHSVRWDDRNAVALCAGHHLFFTHHPAAWELWTEREIPERQRLRYAAVYGLPMDRAQVLAELRLKVAA